MPKLGEMGKTGINAPNIPQGLAHTLFCKSARPTPASQSPKGADLQNPAPFL